MFNQTPNIYSLKCAYGESISQLNAFDTALLKSGVGNVNLVKMSSILPPNCRYKENIVLPPGDLVPVAYASISSDKKGELISASVALGIPKDKSKNGLIMEYENIGITKEEAEFQVREMVKWGMDYRGFEIEEIQSIAVSHKVENCGSVFASVVLWWE